MDLTQETKDLLRLNLQFFADDDPGDDSGNEGDQGGEGDNPGDDGADDGGGDANDSTLQMTQEELDALIEKRIKRERKKFEKEKEREREKQKMTDEEKAETDRKEAERQAEEKVEAANQRIINSEAKAVALEAGIDPNKLKYALKLADLEGVEVDDDGEVDTKAIQASINSVLKDMPELKKGGSPKGGGDFGGGNGGTLTEEQVANMSPDEINRRWSEVAPFLQGK